ncbi:MAG: FAD-binding oxidoreductase [Methylococcaceae bacterium]|nr:FAD-binding oxidoreductase [Methylococcaceae bacterium]
MKSQRPIGYLIIGQGLAGSILAWLLEQHGQDVAIVDKGHENSASRIAAGIVNPVAGQRLAKHPQTEICLTKARAFYAGLGNFFKQTFYFERPMIRLFASEKERTIWTERKSDPAYFPFLGESFSENRGWPAPANRTGGFHQKGCGYLDTWRFLDAIRRHFKARSRLFEQEFSWKEISPNRAHIVWNGCRIEHIISCEGFRAGGNPYFSRLPFQFSKGEILTLESADNLPEAIINHGKWLLPLNSRVFKCGATYEWHSLDARPSDPARELLCTTARELLIRDADFRVLAQHAGIRPGSLDKNPFAGIHPAFPRLGIFNGFGSRGVLTIPYYAEQFVRHLVYGTALPREIELGRCLKNDAAG